jgi:hypothetical protein
MENDKQFIFRIARSKSEIEQIHQLNYQTFVEEIPQHSENPDRLLVDRFHDDNIYFIGLTKTEEVVGMISVREKRPFSLDQKINNLDALLPRSGSICEIRLLSVMKHYRNSKVFYGLIKLLSGYCMEKGFDIAIISGTDRQQKLYSHLGFKVFADPVGTPEALYYPMYLTIENALSEFVTLKDPHD